MFLQFTSNGGEVYHRSVAEWQLETLIQDRVFARLRPGVKRRLSLMTKLKYCVWNSLVTGVHSGQPGVIQAYTQLFV